MLRRILAYLTGLIDLAGLRDARRRPRISAATVGRSLLVMLLSRLGSFNGLGQTRPVSAIEVERGLRLRQAVHAPEIAAVREADPQVAQGATVSIGQAARLSHRAVGRLVGG